MHSAFVTSIAVSPPRRRGGATVRAPLCRPLQIRRRYATTNPMKMKMNINIKEPAERGESRTEKPRRELVPAALRRRLGLLISLISPLLVCAVYMAVAEEWSFLDGLYFATTVATTVGYGDLYPEKTPTYIFVASYALFCAVRVGRLLASAVDVAARVGVKACSPDDIYDAERDGWVRLRNTGVLVCVVLLSGWIFYTLKKEIPLIQAAYFVCITASTVGLGDVHPETSGGRLFATGWLILAAVGFANLLARYSEWRGLVRRREELSKVVSEEFCTNSFEAMDRDGTGKLEEAEFLGYSLVKIGAAREEEVQFILSRFKEMDKDASGSLTFEEVKNADSSCGNAHPSN